MNWLNEFADIFWSQAMRDIILLIVYTYVLAFYILPESRGNSLMLSVVGVFNILILLGFSAKYIGSVWESGHEEKIPEKEKA